MSLPVGERVWEIQPDGYKPENSGAEILRYTGDHYVKIQNLGSQARIRQYGKGPIAENTRSLYCLHPKHNVG